MIALALILLGAAPLAAAPAVQEPPPGEPTSEPAPASGEVEAERLIVRAGASTDWRPIGGLREGDTVQIIGVSPDGRWLLVDFGTGQGWVAAEWVSVSGAEELPIASPPTAQPRTSTPTPTETLTPTNTATPTAIPTDTPEPTETPEPTMTDTVPAPTETEPAAAVVAPGAEPGAGLLLTPTPVGPQGFDLRSLDVPQETLGWLAVAAAGLILAAALYLAGRGRRRREMVRYADGFVLDECPVCQMGSLELEENGRRVVRRTVRCDTCRSVLRQVRPGVWRYTIDPLVNPELAGRFNGQDFTDEALEAFAVEARQHPPHWDEGPADESEHFLEALEHLSELEATVIAEQAEEPLDAALLDDGEAVLPEAEAVDGGNGEHGVDEQPPAEFEDTEPVDSETEEDPV